MLLPFGRSAAGYRWLPQGFFPDLIGVARIGAEHLGFAQVRSQGPQAGDVDFRAGVDVILGWYPIGGGHDLQLEDVEPRALAGVAPVKGFDRQ